ncbi:unnamed protein product [Musa acuminata subsp. malaccensis]|uniref:(wild Malaysian banana) hypothetical protein n=1 Tax=Musa acuminata subsp. malaccensis TaxID=214687 RepID=A0A8D7AW75_MUSAM|nr:unnamed protein product [Musa acuminata subsp. malaccensis]
MTPDEADAVVIGFRSPENLPTIGVIISSWMCFLTVATLSFELPHKSSINSSSSHFHCM